VSGLDPQDGFEALGALIARGPAQAVVLQADWAAFAEGFERGQAPLYAALTPASLTLKKEESSASVLRERLQKLPARERLGALQDDLRGLIARALNLPELEAVPAEHLLVEAGVDSLRAVQARNALGKYFLRTFPSKLLFDCPTVKSLSQYMVTEDPGLRALFQEEQAAVVVPESTSQGLLARLAQLSDEEAESLAASLAASTDR
jgi:acyl carrier protein